MKDKKKWGLIIWIGVFLILLYFIQFVRQATLEKEVSYSTFKKYLKSDRIASLKISPNIIRGEYKGASGKAEKFKTVPLNDPKLVEELEEYRVPEYSGEVEKGWVMAFLLNWGPMLLLIVFWLWMIKGMQGGGKQIMSFGRSKAKLQSSKTTKATFADVAGCDEVKEELTEIIEFLKDPKKFQKLGSVNKIICF